MLSFSGAVKTFSSCLKIHCVNVPKLDFQKSVSVFLPQWISNFCLKDEKMEGNYLLWLLETITTKKCHLPFYTLAGRLGHKYILFRLHCATYQLLIYSTITSYPKPSENIAKQRAKVKVHKEQNYLKYIDYWKKLETVLIQKLSSYSVHMYRIR